jgi:F1F0 ATPase subunit 2
MSASLLPVMAALPLGAALAGVYFGGLWVTVRRLPAVRSPLLWLSLGALARLALLVGTVYLAAAWSLEVLAAMLAGFFATRWLLIRRARPHGAR